MIDQLAAVLIQLAQVGDLVAVVVVVPEEDTGIVEQLDAVQLIADGNEEFCAALSGLLHDAFCIQIAPDGNEAVALLDRFQPDVLAVDLSLSGLDGIRVLEYAAEHGHKLKTLVTMSYRSDYIFAKLTQLEVSYVLLKPCNLHQMVLNSALLPVRLCE